MSRKPTSDGNEITIPAGTAGTNVLKKYSLYAVSDAMHVSEITAFKSIHLIIHSTEDRTIDSTICFVQSTDESEKLTIHAEERTYYPHQEGDEWYYRSLVRKDPDSGSRTLDIAITFEHPEALKFQSAPKEGYKLSITITLPKGSWSEWPNGTKVVPDPNVWAPRGHWTEIAVRLAHKPLWDSSIVEVNT
ncbi:hypothetical protein DFH09DRAFT_1374509 [Mycena vulgaris]|nr:hypothetical protein DFH09DRAFT_1374509 [Mycena vulgaris]